ncbi:MAG TPA: tetratricopeptide repeat protein, partial [Vicinamibacteria bacterium]|nr:tetratricopeptide repeat protein [Vicinamibacteria bacterium]
RGPKALLALRLETSDWASAESAARDLLARAPSDAEAARGLAYALVRQDRSREAIDLLGGFLDRDPDPETRALLERFQRDQGSETSLDEARLAHFHVRYDGDAHEDVGREVLRVLDRHYATLVRTFSHQPAAPIPVILLSRQSYYDSTGAPAWSGGQYDGFDGRVRLPIGGLTASLTAELDDTLLHELTHAFVADLSRGVAPREVHEGLAQLMEGKRFQTLLGEQGSRALADGRLRGVSAFYLSALGLVEDLVGQRGQGGINEVLRAMAETGSSDEAFRRVYGKGLEGLQQDWATRLRQRYGS